MHSARFGFTSTGALSSRVIPVVHTHTHDANGPLSLSFTNRHSSWPRISSSCTYIQESQRSRRLLANIDGRHDSGVRRTRRSGPITPSPPTRAHSQCAVYKYIVSRFLSSSLFSFGAGNNNNNNSNNNNTRDRLLLCCCCFLKLVLHVGSTRTRPYIDGGRRWRQRKGRRRRQNITRWKLPFYPLYLCLCLVVYCLVRFEESWKICLSHLNNERLRARRRHPSPFLISLFHVRQNEKKVFPADGIDFYFLKILYISLPLSLHYIQIHI